MTRRGQISPRRPSHTTTETTAVSPNGFGILAQVSDEDGADHGRIDTHEETHEKEQGTGVVVESDIEDTCEVRETEGDSVACMNVKPDGANKKGNAKHINRSRGPPKPIVNRKESGTTKTTSSRK